ncbi:MAG: isocitrate lyase, partial [Armatimonadetes bacterium]|nr:isocitrate lyase [Armatimonadota bacterium]
DTLLIARTDAHSATLLTSDIDPYDQKFLTGDRTHEGFFGVRKGIEHAIARARAYAPYADLLWFETSTPDINEARQFAEEIHREFPGKLLAYNCSPSFNWKLHMDEARMESFQSDLGKMGYKFQFVTLSAFHQLNFGMFTLARAYSRRGMAAYSELQQQEFAAEADGYEAVKHQQFVGTGYFDEVTTVATSGMSSTTAMEGSTETEQFHVAPH